MLKEPSTETDSDQQPSPEQSHGTPKAGPESEPEGDAAAAESAAQAPAEEPPAESGEQVDVQAVVAERDRAFAAKAELLDRYQRAQAEFENARRRLLREKDDAHQYAAMGVIESLLPILDDFERALDTPDLDPEFHKGLDLIYKRIIDEFTRAGMKPVDEQGKFDPHLHHAVDRAPAESDEHDQTILEVYRRGYHFKDRLLRPAMVKVAVKDD